MTEPMMYGEAMDPAEWAATYPWRQRYETVAQWADADPSHRGRLPVGTAYLAEALAAAPANEIDTITEAGLALELTRKADAELAQRIHTAAAAEGAGLETLAEGLALGRVEIKARWLAWAWTQHRDQAPSWDEDEADAVAEALDCRLEWRGGRDVYRLDGGTTPPTWTQLVAQRTAHEGA